MRRLPPFHANVKKRLVKSPRVYVRDSGLTHALLGLANANQLSGHPVYGSSWEGFVIENLLACAPERTAASFYRTAAGAEIDLVLDLPGGKRWTVEIKSGLAPALEKGFTMPSTTSGPSKVSSSPLGPSATTKSRPASFKMNPDCVGLEFVDSQYRF